MAGYSGTPLPKKLGMLAGQRVAMIGAPTNFAETLDPLPAAIVFADVIDRHCDLVLVFTTTRVVLGSALSICRETLRPDATVWACWPKKTSRVATEVDEHVIRDLALPLGFVDVKVCAVDAIWSGLKLVVRKTLR